LSYSVVFNLHDNAKCEDHPTKRLVKCVDEVHAGDVIEYKHCWLPHTAVVSETNTYIPADIIELKYVHVDENGNVVESSKTIDLENRLELSAKPKKQNTE
jgi:hypothetical protein